MADARPGVHRSSRDVFVSELVVWSWKRAPDITPMLDECPVRQRPNQNRRMSVQSQDLARTTRPLFFCVISVVIWLFQFSNLPVPVPQFLQTSSLPLIQCLVLVY